MRPHNSSTSNSEPAGDDGAVLGGVTGRHDRREALIVATWFVLFLAVADVAVNRLFPLPRDPRVRPGRFAEYFNYGLSIESKIRRVVGPTDATCAPFVLSGWVDDQVERGRKEPAAPPGTTSVSFYGMSFSNDIARTLAEVDPRVRLRLFSGPAAPPNHSYAIYSIDRGGPSRVVVLGILGSSIAGLLTNNAMTWHFEAPPPFTYPRYFARSTGLVAEWPLVRTLDDLRQRLRDRPAWDAYVDQIRETDDFYNSFLFRHDLGDASTLVKMVRRAVAQRWQASRIAQIHGPNGFVESSPAIAALCGIVADFAASARRDRKIPIALLIQDQGYSDHVYRAVAPVLERDRIPYLSTHTICPDTDPRNFVADGHFTPAAYQRIARALRDLMRRELAGS